MTNIMCNNMHEVVAQTQSQTSFSRTLCYYVYSDYPRGYASS